MVSRQITHVSKNMFDTITEVGSRGIWRESVPVAVAQITRGAASYYVHEVGQRADVHVVNAQPPYLRSDADKTSRNNLDNLPRF